jgi:hypothetical protein
MTLEDKKAQLENQIVEINDRLRFPNHIPTKEKMESSYKHLQRIRIVIWNVEKRIKLNNKLKKIKDV